MCRWQPWGAVLFLALLPPPGATLASGLAVTSTLVWRSLAGARPQTCPQVTALHCRLTPDSPQEAGERGSQDDASRPLQTPAVPAHQYPTIGAWVAFLAAARGSGGGRKPPVPSSCEDPA